MTGLVFEGGGTKGAYQIGAYYAFQKCHIKFDAIVGNSIGAFNAAMVVAGKKRQLLKFWQKADVGQILGFSDNYIETMNTNSSIFKKIYSSSFEFLKVLINRGLNVDRLKITLSSLLSEQDIRKSKIEFGLNTIKLKGFKPLYLFKDEIPNGELLDFIIASCFLPVFKMEKIVDGEYYIDGGFFDKSPSNMLEKKGYDNIYIIALNGIGFTQRKINKAKLTIISPSRDLGSILNINKKTINFNIKLGFYDTIKRLKNLDGYKYIFKKYNNNFYNRLVKKIEFDELKHMQNYFLTDNSKALVILALEYVISHENKTYFRIYNPIKEIIRIKMMKNNDAVYQFIKHLRLL